MNNVILLKNMVNISYCEVLYNNMFSFSLENGNVSVPEIKVEVEVPSTAAQAPSSIEDVDEDIDILCARTEALQV